jgi:hypothetical protein
MNLEMQQFLAAFFLFSKRYLYNKKTIIKIMKYLKKFENHTQYETYMGGGGR